MSSKNPFESKYLDQALQEALGGIKVAAAKGVAADVEKMEGVIERGKAHSRGDEETQEMWEAREMALIMATQHTLRVLLNSDGVMGYLRGQAEQGDGAAERLLNALMGPDTPMVPHDEHGYPLSLEVESPIGPTIRA